MPGKQGAKNDDPGAISLGGLRDDVRGVLAVIAAAQSPSGHVYKLY